MKLRGTYFSIQESKLFSSATITLLIVYFFKKRFVSCTIVLLLFPFKWLAIYKFKTRKYNQKWKRAQERKSYKSSSYNNWGNLKPSAGKKHHQIRVKACLRVPPRRGKPASVGFRGGKGRAGQLRASLSCWGSEPCDVMAAEGRGKELLRLHLPPPSSQSSKACPPPPPLP